LRIDYKAFTFSLEAKDILLLPSYKGSTLRGGFGNAFRRVVCALRKTDCADCILKEKCVYSYVFETPPPSDTKIMKKYTNAPHPFVIDPSPEKRQAYKPGDEITFGLTLIGRAIDYLPYFIYTFDELGKIGLGKGRGKYELKAVRDISVRDTSDKMQDVSQRGNGTNIIYNSSSKTLKSSPPSSLFLDFVDDSSLASRHSHLSLSFLTPTRINYGSDLVLDLEFHILLRQLLRRLYLLYYFHCNGDPSAWDFKGMIEKAKEVKTVKRNLRWYDWERFSARQDTRMKMGGFVGEITFEGDIGPFIPLIEAGEVLHVGKGTGFGLGRYGITDRP
jgi:CRISPR-associated endoribonuclease Cas6